MASGFESWGFGGGSSGGGGGGTTLGWNFPSSGGSSAVSVAHTGGGGGGGGGWGFPGEHLVNEAVHLSEGVGQGLYNMGHAVVEDNAQSLKNLATGHWDSGTVGPITFHHTYQDVLVPIAHSYALKYGPAFHGDFGTTLHRMAADPLGTFLDVATLVTVPFTGGGSAAFRGAALGLDAARLTKGAELARAAADLGETLRAPVTYDAATGEMVGRRTLTYKTAAGETRTVPLSGSANPMTRASQAAFDELSRRLPASFGRGPFTRLTLMGRGERAYVANSLRRSAAEMDRAVQPFRDAVSKLDPVEQVASVLAAMRINPRTLISLWQQTHGEIQAAYGATVRGAIPNGAIHNLAFLQEHQAEIEKVLADANANPAVRKAVEAGRVLIKKREQWLEEAGKIQRSALQTHVERAIKVAAGSRFKDEERKLLGYTQKRATYKEMAGKLENAKRSGDPAQIKAAEDALRHATTRPGKKVPFEHVVPAHWTDVPQSAIDAAQHGIDPLYGDPYYIPHVAPYGTISERIAAGGRGALTAIGARDRVGLPPLPPGLARSEFKRLMTGDLILHPELISQAYLRSVRWRTMNAMWDWAATHAEPLSQDTESGVRYGLKKGYKYLAPRGVTIPKQLEHGTDIRNLMEHQEAAIKENASHAQDLKDALRHIFPNSREAKTIEELTKQGVKQVPEFVWKTVEQEFRHNALVSKIFDRPMDFWRALVLSYRPAWLVNNIVGQHLLFGIAHAGFHGLRAYLRAIQLKKGDRAIRPLIKLGMTVPGLRPTMIDLVRSLPGGEHIVYGVSHSLLPAEIARGLETGKWATVKSGFKKVDLGRAMRWANINIADDVTRTAAALAQIRRDPQLGEAYNVGRGWVGVGGQIKRIIETATPIPSRLLGEKQTLQEFIGSLNEHEVRRLTDLVNKDVGAFLTLSPLERDVLRRIFPFYSWFKVITTLSMRMGLHDPQRALMLLNLEKASQITGIGQPSFAVPDYLSGAIAYGPVKGGVQPMISTTGLNPFQTNAQLIDAAGQFLNGQPTFGSGGPMSLMNPMFGIAIQASGTDPFYGTAYQGPLAGHGWLGRAAAGFVTGLPEYRVVEQATPGAIGSSYKSTLYANSPLDFWLNFLGLPIKKVNKAESISRYEAQQNSQPTR